MFESWNDVTVSLWPLQINRVVSKILFDEEKYCIPRIENTQYKKLQVSSKKMLA